MLYFVKILNSNLSFAKVRKNILFSKFLANYLNIRVYFMVLFAEKSQKMVLLVKTDVSGSAFIPCIIQKKAVTAD